jgi:hypothetical protein
VIWLFWSDTNISSTYFLLHFGKYKRHLKKGLSWPWSYGSSIYNYLCNQCISPLMLWVQISIRARCTTLCDKFCQWLATGRCFSLGSWIYNYICNQCISSLMLWVQISIRARCTTLCDKFCQWLATGWCFSSGPPVSSTNKSDRSDITELSLKVALNTIKQANILKIYQIKHKIYPNHQDEWYVYHRDLSRYVSDPHIYDKQ